MKCDKLTPIYIDQAVIREGNNTYNFGGAEVSDNLKVIRRDDTEWHEPTVDYMGLEA